MLFCENFVLFEMVILNDLVIYCKTKGGQNDENDWKNEQNPRILQKIQKLLGLEWRII